MINMNVGPDSCQIVNRAVKDMMEELNCFFFGGGGGWGGGGEKINNLLFLNVLNHRSKRKGNMLFLLL